MFVRNAAGKTADGRNRAISQFSDYQSFQKRLKIKFHEQIPIS